MDLAKAIRQSLEFWNNPPMTELPPETVTNVANRRVSERFLDLDLTPDACFQTAKSDPFTFDSVDARECPIGTFISDISRVSRVESRGNTSTSEDDWEEERVVSFENWNDVMERTDGNYCAFYGGPNEARMLVVNRDVSDLEFRIVYKQLQTRIETTQDLVDLPDICETLLVYDMALEFSELIDNQSPEFIAKKRDKMAYLADRLEETLRRFEKWRRSQKGTSIVTRRAFNDRQGAVQTGRRRFSVNF